MNVRTFSFACLAVLAIPTAASGQDHLHATPTWAADLGLAGANVMAGGVTAAVTAAIRGEDVADAFLKGAVGGGVVFVGKRTAVEGFAGAGLLGREVASVGSSVVANGAQGRGWLSEVWLPVGPAWLQVRPEARLRARLDLGDVATLIWAATRSELRFDLERSLSNGASVFVAPDHRIRAGSAEANGFAQGGVVVLGAGRHDVELVQRHENVHVIQHDYLLQTVTRPVERWGWRLVTERTIPLDVNLLPLVATPVLRSLHQSEATELESR
jgi:hypothetical protein